MKTASLLYALLTCLTLPAQAASLVDAAHASAQCVLTSREPALRLIGDATAWQALSAEGPLPEFVTEPDWQKQTILVLTRGVRPSAGYALSLKAEHLQGKTLVLDIAEDTPPAGAMTAQVITQPCLFLTLRKQGWTQIQIRAADTHARLGQVRRQP
ncbi:MAG: hypothetical protein H6R19_3320 [Proteobacteria bacterium]|nr:hypothetical protein [Pseudomonadota bacterium]